MYKLYFQACVQVSASYGNAPIVPALCACPNFYFSLKWKVKVLVTESCLTQCDPWTVAHHAPLSMAFSRQEYWSGSHALLWGIFLTQGWNPGLLRCRQIIYCLSHREAQLAPHQKLFPLQDLLFKTSPASLFLIRSIPPPKHIICNSCQIL